MLSITSLLPHFLAMLVLSSPAAPAVVIPELSDPHAGPWQKTMITEGVTVWSRQMPHTRIEQIRVEVVIPHSIKHVWQVMSDVLHYPEIIPQLASVAIVDRDGPLTEYVYQRIDPPLLRDRDYTLKMMSQIKPEQGYYQRTWHIVQDRGPPPSSTLVRLQLCNGGWRIQALDDHVSHVTYWLHTDPAVNAPVWLTNKANRDAITHFLKQVRQRAATALPKLTQSY